MYFDPLLEPVEAELLAAVSADELMEFTAQIAAEVRLSGSPEERRALERIEQQLAGWGYTTRLLEHDAYISLPGPAALEVEGLGSLNCITHSFAVSTALEGLRGMVVDIGGGSEAEWAAADVRGKIALISGLATPAQARRANAAGSIAQIFINDDNLHEMILSPVWGSPTPEQRMLYPRTPAVSVRAPDGARIREALGRDGQLEALITSSVETGWRTLPILQADLAGSEGEHFVLFSGHIDSWHYGAMDNGSANATMVHLARLFAERRGLLRRGLRLCFWSGHSHGRYAGSAWYVDSHWEELYHNCAGHVNIDSVGGKGATLLSEGYHMAETFDLGREVIGHHAGTEFLGARVGRAGDQSFSGIGIPALLMTVSEQPPQTGAISASALLGGRSGGLGWWWHTTEDTLDKLDPQLLARDARLYAAVLLRFLAEPLLPLNYAAAADELESFVAGYAEALGGRFDLGPARARAQALCAEAQALEAACERVRPWAAEITPERLADLNAALMRLGRATIPLNYTAAGPFDHDPALAQPPLPLLAEARRLAASAPGSDDEKFIAVGLRRSLNRVAWQLAEAQRAAAEARSLAEAF